jgi:HEAT repeat protein
MNLMAVSLPEKALEKLLSSEFSAMRLVGVKYLCRVNAPWAVPMLIRALQDEDNNPEICSIAAAALGKSGDPRAVDALMEALDKPWQADLERVIEGLGELGDARAIDKLFHLLGYEFPFARLAAAAALDRLGESRWRELVKGEPRDFLCLGISEDARVIPLLQCAMKSAWHEDAAYAAGGLAFFGAESAIEALVKALDDEDALVQKAAADALGSLGNQRALDALQKALAHPEPRVRIWAACELGKRRYPIGIQSLSDAIDYMKALRGEIAIALGKTGEPSAIEPLYRLLLDSAPYVRFQAVHALEDLGEPEWPKLIHGNADDFDGVIRAPSLPSLKPLLLFVQTPLDSGDEYQRVRAIRKMAMLGGTSIEKDMIGILFSSSGIVRIAAADAMAWLGDACWLLLNQEDVRAFHAYFNADPPPFYPLKQVLGDSRACEGIREAAANLLGMPGVKGSRIPLIMALAGPVPVRKAAANSLAKRGKPRWRDLVKGDPASSGSAD